MTKAADRERAKARREADKKFYGEFEAYMLECFKKPGFKLESEQQLAQRFGVTRYKVRKAIEGLNQSGVLTRKKHGGSVVNEVTAEGLSEQLSRQFRVAGCEDKDYAEAVEWLLTGLVPDFCEKADATVFSALFDMAEQLEETAEGTEADRIAVGFLTAVVGALENRAASIFWALLEVQAASVVRAGADSECREALAECMTDFLKDARKGKPKKAAAAMKSLVKTVFSS